MRTGTLLVIAASLIVGVSCSGKQVTDYGTYQGFTEAEEPGATLHVFYPVRREDEGREDEEKSPTRLKIRSDHPLKGKLQRGENYKIEHEEPCVWNLWNPAGKITPDTTSTKSGLEAATN